MRYSVLSTTTTRSGYYRHCVVRDGKLTTFYEYGKKRTPPKRLLRWLKKLNEKEGHNEMSILRKLSP
jgi:hypothetical protein